MGRGRGHVSRQVSALTAALDVLGCDATYEELRAASGAAFSLAWVPGAHNYAVCEACQEEMVVSGARAAGASVERQACETSDDMRDRVRASVESGRPAGIPYALGARII